MKLATTTGDFSAYAKTQMEAMEYIHRAGFRYMDYSFGVDYRKRDGFFSGDYQAHLDAMRRQMDTLGIRFVQSHAPMGTPLANDAAARDLIESTKTCIRACGDLGIPSVVVHSGYLEGLSKEENFARNRDFYSELLQVAEGNGVNVLVENFNKMWMDGYYWIDNAADLREMIDYVDHPLFHACWDTGHGNMQDTPQDEALRILGSHVHAVHIQDNMTDMDAHMMPFCGMLNLDSVMHGLLEIGYQGCFTFEAKDLFLSAEQRRPFAGDSRLAWAPLALRIKEEELLYEVGKTVLSAYGCYEV